MVWNNTQLSTDAINVLIADEDAIFVRTAVQFLETQEGITIVGTVEDDGHLVNRAEHLSPQVIVLGATTMDPSRLQTLSDLRSALPDVPVVALVSTDLDPPTRSRLDDLVDALVPKAMLRSRLVPAMRKLLNNGHGRRLTHCGSSTPSSSSGSSSSNSSIMIMEDDAHLRDVFSRALTAAGYQVHQAPTVEAARMLLSQYKFDVLVCDIHVGNSRGTDLLREHGDMLLDSGAQIVMVSGYPRYRAVCEEMGADFFLEKPVSIQTLVTLIRRLAN